MTTPVGRCRCRLDFVIGQDGVILYAEANPDYTRRPEPEALLPALERAASVKA